MIEGPGFLNRKYNKLNLILQNFAQIVLLFMSINQESLLLSSMPNSAITVSQMHIRPQTHFQKAVGGV